MMTRRSALGAVAAGALHAAVERDYFPPPDKQGGWRALTAKDKIRRIGGMEPDKLDATFEYAKTSSQHGGLVVVRHGWIVYENYFGRGNREAAPESRSCGKCISSICTGMAIQEKRAMIPGGLETKIMTAKYLPPDFLPLDDPRKAEIKLGHILCMSSGLRGNSPGYVNGKPVTIDPPDPTHALQITDEGARMVLQTSLWCDPGGGYSYCSPGTQFLSILVRRLMGMELGEYFRRRIAEPSGWGEWDWAMYRPKLTAGIDSNGRLLHTPAAGSICLKAADALRFMYLLLHEGRWGNQQLVPAEYIRIASKRIKYNTHYPYSLQFNVNGDGHMQAPRDAYYKSGAGGFSWYVVPSLDLIAYKIAGVDADYDPSISRLPVRYKYDGSRDGVAIDRKIQSESVEKTLEKLVDAVTA